MTPSNLLKLFRKEVDDEAEPQLWSDFEFFVYLNDAQDVFVRETGGLSDRRSTWTTMKYKTGDKFRKYNPRILRISGAQDENKKFIGIRNFDNIESGMASDDYGNRTINSFDDDLTGPVNFLITDVEAKEVQLYPVPDHDGTLQLFIKRLPLKEIEDGDSVLEINDQYHLELLSWVKYKCYSKQDSEVFDPKKAAEFRTEWDRCTKKAGKEKTAREDRKRTVRYGGI
jgi:hypothetical protein